MAHICDRFYSCKWGVFNHFLWNKDLDWNVQTRNFDVEKVARQLHEIGAKYYFITLMQGTKYMLAPNDTYNRITGYKPGEACCERDTIADLIAALDKYGIDLYLYYTGDGPHLDEQAGTKMGYYDVDGMWALGEDGKFHLKDPLLQITDRFVENWAAVLEEYALRYGDKIKGWWIDGCYDYIGYTPEILDIYKNAARKGNPNAIVAFNNGVRLAQCPQKWGNEDFTAGESTEFCYIPDRRFVDGAQMHRLLTLGYRNDSPQCDDMVGWCSTGLLVSGGYLRDYINRAHKNGAVTTIDIKVYPDGSFDKEQMDALKMIK